MGGVLWSPVPSVVFFFLMLFALLVLVLLMVLSYCYGSY